MIYECSRTVSDQTYNDSPHTKLYNYVSPEIKKLKCDE